MSIINSFNNWDWFKLSDLFEIKKGKRLTKANMTKGQVPFIGSIDSNNGYREYIGQTPIHTGNTITVNYNGSVAEAFYQPKSFWASDDVNVLYPKFTLNPYIALFITTIIKIEKYRFNYGRKWHVERMSNSNIKLPIDKNTNPDWQNIERFIKNLTVVKKYDLENISVIKEPLINASLSIETTDWKWFEYQELFNIERGRGPRKKNLDGTGNTPVVTSSDSNNGWTAVTTVNPIHAGNTIGVNRNGSIAESFYQPIPFCSTEDVHIFKPKFQMNKYVGLFISTLIKKEKYRYNYGRKWGIARMKSSKIKLPINDAGNPDYEYMEKFIKSLSFSKQI